MVSFKKIFVLLNAQSILMNYFTICLFVFPVAAGDSEEDFDTDSFIICGYPPEINEPCLPHHPQYEICPVITVSDEDEGNNNVLLLELLFQQAPALPPEESIYRKNDDQSAGRLFAARSQSLPNPIVSPTPTILGRTYSHPNEVTENLDDPDYIYILEDSNSAPPRSVEVSRPKKKPRFRNQKTIKTRETLQPFVAQFSLQKNDNDFTKWDGRRAPYFSREETMYLNGNSIGCFSTSTNHSKRGRQTRRGSTGNTLYY